MSAVVELKGAKTKVAKEVAEREFERLCEANRVDSEATGSDEEREAFAKLKEAIVRYIQLGRLVVSDDGRPTYTPPGSSKGYTFRAPTAASFISAESGKTGKNHERLMFLVAELTGTDRTELAKMHGKDWQACQAIVTLFLAEE